MPRSSDLLNGSHPFSRKGSCFQARWMHRPVLCYFFLYDWPAQCRYTRTCSLGSKMQRQQNTPAGFLAFCHGSSVAKASKVWRLASIRCRRDYSVWFCKVFGSPQWTLSRTRTKGGTSLWQRQRLDAIAHILETSDHSWNQPFLSF